MKWPSGNPPNRLEKDLDSQSCIYVVCAYIVSCCSRKINVCRRVKKVWHLLKSVSFD